MKTALITGGARRIGAEITKTLHKNNFNVIIHCHESIESAKELAEDLNRIRDNSASIVQFDLKDIHSISQHVEEVQSLDVLINNASIFYPTPLDSINTQAVLDLMQVNCFAPYFLSIALKDKLTQKEGQIINLVDIYSHKPIKDYSAYSMSKSALAMLTKSLALDLAPHVRVCGVSPGAILWPSQSTEKEHTRILDKVPLKAKGDPKNITESVIFLINSSYITGEILTVDGGRLIA
jgi:pteridine reductase